MSIKVVSIISRMNVGGPAVLLQELISNLPTGEFEHILITGVCEENEEDFLASHPLVSRVEYVNNLKRSLIGFSEISAFLDLLKLLREFSPDIIHTHTSKAGVLGRIAAKIASPKSKIVHTYHGHLLYGYFNQIKVCALVFIEKLLAHITDELVSVSKQVMLDLKNVGIGRNQAWRVIYPGVKFSKSSPILRDYSPATFTLIWIGRFTAIKDPLFAVKVFAFLKERCEFDLNLMMVGDGELWDDSVALARDLNVNIEFLGWVSPVDKILSGADLLLMTSLNEGMPVTILEAARSGIPTISTDVGGIREFISDGNTGFLVRHDYSEMGLRIKGLIESNHAIKDAGMRAYDLAESNFSSQKYLLDHLELYRFLKSH